MNTEVPVTLNDALDSQHMRRGDPFDVTVARDVVRDGRVVIPRGTPGKGEIAYRQGKGAFGKTGKLEIVLRSLQVDGRTLPLNGRFRQNGKGNAGAVVGTIVLAGAIAGAFVTGHSAVIEQGREFKAFTAEPWPLTAPALQVAAVTPPPAALIVAVPPVPAAPPAIVAAVVPVQPVAAKPVLAVQPAAVIVAAAPAVAAAPVVVKTVMPIVVVPARQPALATIAVVRPFGVVTPAFYAPGPDQIAAYQRRLDAQHGIHGRDARQGWTISE